MRITVDLDYPSQLQLLKTYFNMKTMGIVEIAESSGGKGYHLIVSGLPLSFQQAIEIRRWLGDDQQRIKFDLQHKNQSKPKQILFTKKGKKRIRWLTEKNILALPFYSKWKPLKTFRVNRQPCQ